MSIRGGEYHTRLHNERQVRQAIAAIERHFEEYEDIPEQVVRVSITTEYNRLKARTLPEVPEDSERELAWLEWMDVGDDALHFFYHRAEADSPYNPGPDRDIVLTSRARADELAARPCPTCYPADERNDDLDVGYFEDEKGGLHRRIASKDIEDE